MDRFQSLQSFIAVVEAGSFVRGAEALRISKAAISRNVAELEAHLGTRLLNRTTRRQSLTDEGRLFYERSKEVLAGLESAEAELSTRSSEISGRLRINAPMSFGILHLAPAWPAFIEANPKVELEVTLADRVVDLVDEGYDLAVRIARLPDSTLISRQVASTRLLLCATPEYLARRGTPAHPRELAGHDIVSYSYWSTRDEWHFEGPDGHVSVQTRPVMTTNNGETCRAAVLAHRCISLHPSFLISEDLRAGRVVELMPEYQAVTLGIYAVYPSRRHLQPRIKAMVEFLTEYFREPAWSV